MSNKVIAQGAEAIISKSGNKIIKDRIKKSYRLPFLDEKLRRQRTRKEIRLLEKASKIIQVPKIIKSGEYKIELELIKGKKLSEALDKLKNKEKISQQIGINIAKLHDANIIHGDLTTSNMILKNNEVYFIDFGLGFESNKIEDKAVDLHLIKEALEAKHYKYFEKLFSSVLKGYKSSVNSRDVLKRLEAVEQRGRYKAQY